MSSAEKPDYVAVQEYLLQEQSSIIKHEYVDGWVSCSLALKDVYDGVTFSSVNVKEAEMLYEKGFKD
ncbi:MAG: hypothetical protein LW850_17365 [Planctomycetaceae bacterium]|jgi:exonuclease III|nr:hypothetical protein [Planctomycetaceae bacterium]